MKYKNAIRVFLMVLLWGAALDLPAPAQSVTMKEVGRLTLPGWTTSVTLSGSLCYLASSGRLYAVDVQDPASPVVLGSRPITGGRIFLGAPYLYVSGAGLGGDNDLQIIDVTDPQDMRLLGTVQLDRVSDVFVVEPYAYVISSFHHRLYIIDISAPKNPQVISLIEVVSAPHAIAVAGNYAYVAEGIIGLGGGVRIYDVTDPFSILQVGVFFQGFNYADQVAVVDNYVYLLNRDGFQIIDFADLSLPLELSFQVYGQSLRHGIKIVGDRAYLTAYQEIFVLDIGDRAAPRLLGRYRPPAPSWDLVLDKSYLYIADSTAGLLILRYQ